MNFRNLKLFASHFTLLEDNKDYCDHLKMIDQDCYLIVRSTTSPIKEITAELEGRRIPYTIHNHPSGNERCILVDERYLWIL